MYSATLTNLLRIRHTALTRRLVPSSVGFVSVSRGDGTLRWGDPIDGPLWYLLPRLAGPTRWRPPNLVRAEAAAIRGDRQVPLVTGGTLFRTSSNKPEQASSIMSRTRSKPSSPPKYGSGTSRGARWVAPAVAS